MLLIDHFHTRWLLCYRRNIYRAMEGKLLEPNQYCIAVDDFIGYEHGDLSLVAGEKVTILRESGMMYWYIAKNKRGETGTVPSNYLEPYDPPPPPIPIARPRQLTKQSSSILNIFDEDYQQMNPAGIDPTPMLPPALPVIKPKPKKKKKPVLTEADKQMLALIERDKVKRLAKATLVIATATYRSNSPGDLNFKIHEEMIISEPAKDLCWYKAHKADNPTKSGLIPLTHVRLVYMSDEEDEPEIDQEPIHERIYDDKNDFLSNSGWFNHPGIPMGKEAHLHCLARKADMSYETFMSTEEAIYSLKFMNEEKTYIGKAQVLHEELAHHFECFGLRQKEIREIDDDLCHHTNSGGWKLKVWPIDGGDLEVEFAKKVIEYDSLMSSDGGINESLVFTNRNSFDKFWAWLSPN